MRRWPVAVGLALLPIALAVRLFVVPFATTGPADAVVLLAGDSTARLALAVHLARESAGVLVVSAAGGEDNAAARALCRAPEGLVVHCFTPSRSDTRAEARAIGRLADQYRWTRITVVTSSYHVVRAGLLVQRCTQAEVQTAYARPPMPFSRWFAALVHETAGLAVASLEWGC